VLVMAPNGSDFVTAVLACASTAAVFVPVSTQLTPRELAHLLTDCGPRMILHAAEYADVVRAAVAQAGAETPQVAELGGFVATPRSDLADDVDNRAEPDDLLYLGYTSGTTGAPKGCVLTHRNLSSCATNAIPGLHTMFTEGASTLLFLPLAHAFARMIQIGCVEGRATLAHTADVKNLLTDLASYRPTFLLSVPRVFEKVYNTARQKAHASGKGGIFDRAERVAIGYSESLDNGGPGLALRLQHRLFDTLVYSKLRDALGGRCGHAISGGAPLGARLAHFYRGIGVTVYEGYGLTETSPATNVNSETALKIGTVGRPLPGVTEQIADDGEILIKGDLVFQGYWNDKTATAEAIDSDGWFHTGDIGRLDDDGYLTITGRKKELIVTAGGKNVAPAVLEDRVRAHPLVSQCVVVGDRRPFVAALVTLDE
ncbi:MAG: AMP-dependent synthetase/ligase, partial [Micromonosporaceae bacterium]